MTTHIAVDIGGTRMRAATYRLDSLTPIKIERIKTRKKGSTPQERLEKLIASVWPEDDEVAAIGIAVPGPVNCTTQTIEKAPNVPELSGLPISQMLQERFSVPTYLGNDANLAALGEWKFGAGRGHHYMIYLTARFRRRTWPYHGTTRWAGLRLRGARSLGNRSIRDCDCQMGRGRNF